MFQHRRVACGLAISVQQPGVFKPFTSGHSLARHRRCGDAGADVDQHRVVAGVGAQWITEGIGVGREQRLGAAIGRNTLAGGVWVGHLNHQALVGRLFGQRGQAADVVTAADGHGGPAVFFCARYQHLDGMFHQPQTRQITAAPDGTQAIVLHDNGCAALGHAAFGQFGQVQRRHCQAVGAAAHGVGQHLQPGHTVGHVRLQPCSKVQRGRKRLGRCEAQPRRCSRLHASSPLRHCPPAAGRRAG